MLLECQRLKAQVVQEIRANQQLEQDLNIMDIKIGLLVKNRITLQVGVAATSCTDLGRAKHQCIFPRMLYRSQLG